MRKIVLMIVILTMISSSWVFAETTVSHERRSHVLESQSDVKKAPMKENKITAKKTTENDSANDKTDAESNTVSKNNGQSNVTVKAASDIEKKNIYHGVSVYTTRNDAEEKYNAALLDAKRNAVEQAGTFIEVHTDMKNFEITTDEIKVLSTAVVKLVPNSVKKQVVSNTNGIMKIRVEADFEVDITKLHDVVKEKTKDSYILVTKVINGVNINSIWFNKREDGKRNDISIGVSITYYNDYRKIFHEIFFTAWRDLENDIPVIISEKYPLAIVFTPQQGEKEYIYISPKDAYSYSSGDVLSIHFRLKTAGYIANWARYRVSLRYYEKNGIMKETFIPQNVLDQWREMIVAPQAIVENS